MQEAKVEFQSVDNKNIALKLLCIIGAIVSISLLLVSFCFENTVLIILDGILPLIVILYRLIKRKKFPIYYYSIGLSGLYPICWYIFMSPDFTNETAKKSTDFFVIIIAFTMVFLTLFLINISYRKKLTRKKLLHFEYVVLALALIIICVTQFFAVNVLLDKPYKIETAYAKDIYPAAKGFTGTVDYTESSSVELHSIKFNDNIFTETEILKTWDTYDWILKDKNGNYIFMIEYGNGALGIPWRRIIGNK